jgi:DNA polymerase-2
METFEGFIVHAYPGKGKENTRIYLVGRLRDGKTFAIVEERERPGFYLRRSDLESVKEYIHKTGGIWDESNLHTMDGEPCIRLSWNSIQQSQRAVKELGERGIRTYEGDIRFTDQFLMNHRIHGSVKIKGAYLNGRRVDKIFINPEIEPSSWYPSLSILSIDIETDPEGKMIYTIGMAFSNPTLGSEIREVHLAYPVERPLWQSGNDKGSRASHSKTPTLFQGTEWITVYPDERSMLEGFCRRVCELDPDIITGWNVIDFDFRVITERMNNYKLPMIIGRSDDPASFIRGDRGRSDTVFIPGRQVLDAVRIVRAAPERFSDYHLETVAKVVLGRQKALEIEEDENKPGAISRLYKEDPVSICKYCMDDAEMVLEILLKTGLLELTLRRCLLIGITLDRAWTSIPAFEHIYIEALHQRGFVAPTIGVDPFPTIRAEGGAILEPKTGLYDNVLVFDFKSLYPSIIRTFNIDPISFVHPEKLKDMSEADKASLIRAPNGAFFRREAAILPELLERFFENRALAKQRGDEIASFVYKIIMNTFYGVLGADGCRFASGYLSGAITSFGHHILHWCEQYIGGLGLQVIYGDTDSLFVLSGLPQKTPVEELAEKSKLLCNRINTELREYIDGTYNVSCFLELEFVKVYYRFFIPPVRSSTKAGGEKSRGRAKGYAGLLIPVHELDGSARDSSEIIEVVGMEAVRRDWTDLARMFQVGLLELLFRGESEAAFQLYIDDIVKRLYSGELDDKLIYRKALRKPIAEYTRTTPPHVKAASKLSSDQQRGLIHYIWTVEGPQPAGKLTARIDYEHYLEKQLKPIVQSFAGVTGINIDHLFKDGGQLKIF